MCYVITPEKRNKIIKVAEPLDDGLAEDIESGKVKIKDPQAMASLVLDALSVVPGDLLGREAKTLPLEMASAMTAARDFMLKTRRWKGLSEDVSVGKFLEPDLWKSLKEGGVLDE